MKWILYPKKSDNLIEQLLINRQIKKSQWRSFLKPNFEMDMADPDKMKGIKKASDLLLKSQKVGIFTDYDADGIPAGALLTKALDKLKILWEVYIPERDEGYGLSEVGIKKLFKVKCDTLVTIDLGITAKKQIAFAKKLGLKTIVVDHHLVLPSSLPNADAIVNPKQKNCPYPFKEFSAGGLVYKLIQMLAKQDKRISLADQKWWLDLVAISTISDIVPLTGENRVIAHFGLKVLAKTKNFGLQELYKVGGINPHNMSTYAVGFQIAPRINAPGRLASAKDAFDLLVSDDKNKAQKLAQKLNQANLKRQQELDKAIQVAIAKISQNKLDKNKIILVYDKSFMSGIVGLVAGRIMDKYYRPAIVLREEKGEVHGSARSIEGFHMVDAFTLCQKKLTRFGGHSRAAGLALKIENLQSFYDQILGIADKKLTKEALVPKQKVDARISFDEVSQQNFNAIQKLEPFGFGNARPVFQTNNLVVNNTRTLGKENDHLKLWLTDGKNEMVALAFGCGAKADQFKIGAKADFVYSLSQNNFLGKESIELKLIDYKIHK